MRSGGGRDRDRDRDKGKDKDKDKDNDKEKDGGDQLQQQHAEPVQVPQTVKQTSQIRVHLEGIKLSKARASLARFNLLQFFEALRSRKQFSVGESALASLYGLRAFLVQCADLGELTAMLKTIQKSQADAREAFKAFQAPWDGRRENLERKIIDVEAANRVQSSVLEAIQVGGSVGTGIEAITDAVSLAKAEEESGLWTINEQMDKMAIYERKRTKGVFMEGFLYKKSTSALAIHSWNKRWFVLDGNGLHYLRGGVIKSHAHGMANNENLEMVKVAETLLATVKEVRPNPLFKDDGVFSNPGNSNLRYSFDIISANNRPYTLQAAGPMSFAKWTAAIRKSIERQLTSSAPVSRSGDDNKDSDGNKNGNGNNNDHGNGNDNGDNRNSSDFVVLDNNSGNLETSLTSR